MPGAGAHAGHLCRGVAPSGQSEPKRGSPYKSGRAWEEGTCAGGYLAQGSRASAGWRVRVGKAWCRVKTGPCRARPTGKRVSPSGVKETRMCGVAWPGVSLSSKRRGPRGGHWCGSRTAQHRESEPEQRAGHPRC